MNSAQYKLLMFPMIGFAGSQAKLAERDEWGVSDAWVLAGRAP
jgi:hypothetical protein